MSTNATAISTDSRLIVSLPGETPACSPASESPLASALKKIIPNNLRAADLPSFLTVPGLVSSRALF